MNNIGVDPSKFGLHSFRSGGATSAANNGVNETIVFFSVMGAGSLLRQKKKKSLMSMTVSCKDPQFLSFWAYNFSRLFSFLMRPTLCRSIVFGLVLAGPSLNRCGVETKYVFLTNELVKKA